MYFYSSDRRESQSITLIRPNHSRISWYVFLNIHFYNILWHNTASSLVLWLIPTPNDICISCQFHNCCGVDVLDVSSFKIVNTSQQKYWWCCKLSILDGIIIWWHFTGILSDWSFLTLPSCCYVGWHSSRWSKFECMTFNVF